MMTQKSYPLFVALLLPTIANAQASEPWHVELVINNHSGQTISERTTTLSNRYPAPAQLTDDDFSSAHQCFDDLADNATSLCTLQDYPGFYGQTPLSVTFDNYTLSGTVAYSFADNQTLHFGVNWGSDRNSSQSLSCPVTFSGVSRDDYVVIVSSSTNTGARQGQCVFDLYPAAHMFGMELNNETSTATITSTVTVIDNMGGEPYIQPFPGQYPADPVTPIDPRKEMVVQEYQGSGEAKTFTATFEVESGSGQTHPLPVSWTRDADGMVSCIDSIVMLDEATGLHGRFSTAHPVPDCQLDLYQADQSTAVSINLQNQAYNVTTPVPLKVVDSGLDNPEQSGFNQVLDGRVFHPSTSPEMDLLVYHYTNNNISLGGFVTYCIGDNCTGNPTTDDLLTINWSTTSNSDTITCGHDAAGLPADYILSGDGTRYDNTCEFSFRHVSSGSPIKWQYVFIKNAADPQLDYNAGDSYADEGKFRSTPPSPIIEQGDFYFDATSDGNGLAGGVTYHLTDNVYQGNNVLKLKIDWILPKYGAGHQYPVNHVCESAVQHGNTMHPKYLVNVDLSKQSDTEFECEVTLTPNDVHRGTVVFFNGAAGERSFYFEEGSLSQTPNSVLQAEFEDLPRENYHYQRGNADDDRNVMYRYYSYDSDYDGTLSATASYRARDFSNQNRGTFTLYTEHPHRCEFEDGKTSWSGDGFTIKTQTSQQDGMLTCYLKISD